MLPGGSIVTNGRSRASRRSVEAASGGVIGPRCATAAASASTSAGKPAGRSNWARIRRNASRNGDSAAGAWTFDEGTSVILVLASSFDACATGRVGIVRPDERKDVVRLVAEGNELSPAAHLGLLPCGGEQFGVGALEEVTSEEHHRAANFVQRQAVLRRVREDLFGGPRTARGIHHSGASDREQPVLADAVGEVLGDVRGEGAGGLVDVDPGWNAQALR